MGEGRVAGPSNNGIKISNPNMLGLEWNKNFHRILSLTRFRADDLMGNTINSCILHENKFHSRII